MDSKIKLQHSGSDVTRQARLKSRFTALSDVQCARGTKAPEINSEEATRQRERRRGKVSKSLLVQAALCRVIHSRIHARCSLARPGKHRQDSFSLDKWEDRRA